MGSFLTSGSAIKAAISKGDAEYGFHSHGPVADLRLADDRFRIVEV
jgi:hypothetical protein